ncbi:MAG: hypothetical protein HOO96_14685 [Polyangiaceae bacterium]|nr:hypothetical protein [Polyangiaceae bacterium]
MASLNPESVDLAALADVLRAKLGDRVVGDVVARTKMRDAIADHLRCSELEAELLTDTMVGRGFVTRHVATDGTVSWILKVEES